MPKLEVTMPTGELIAPDDRLIPINAAAFAENAYLARGRFESLKGKESISATLAAGVVRSIHFYDDLHWFSWDDNVQAVKSPMAQDQYRRVYFTDNTGAKITSNLIATGSDPKPAADYVLGIPAPVLGITGSVNDSGSDPEEYADDETRFYVMTYVTGYGEEGAQGVVSAAFELKHPDDTVSLTLPILSPNNSNVTHKRIYRTATGSQTEFLFVAEVPLAQTAFTDDIAGDALGGVLSTSDYAMAPEGVKGMCVMANGSVAVFKGNEVMVSEPYLPYAFPFGYRHSTEYDIVSIQPTRTGLVLLTEGTPYVLSGGHPSAMGMEQLDENQACVSQLSAVDMGEFILYASPDGIMAVTESSVRLLTEGVITKETWSNFNPETIHAYRHEDKYIAFYGDTAGDGSGTGGFVFDPKDGSIIRLSDYATAGHRDIKTDTLYLVIGGVLYSWDTGSTPMAFTWRSKIFAVQEIAYNVMRVESQDPSLLGIRLIVDGEEVLNVVSLPSDVFKLPPISGREWQFELTGTGVSTKVVIATDMSEL